MAAEYGNVQDQTVEDNQNVLFDNVISCDRGANAIAGKLEDIIHSDNIAAKLAHV